MGIPEAKRALPVVPPLAGRRGGDGTWDVMCGSGILRRGLVGLLPTVEEGSPISVGERPVPGGGARILRVPFGGDVMLEADIPEEISMKFYAMRQQSIRDTIREHWNEKNFTLSRDTCETEMERLNDIMRTVKEPTILNRGGWTSQRRALPARFRFVNC
jgi:hypothetical protein